MSTEKFEKLWFAYLVGMKFEKPKMNSLVWPRESVWTEPRGKPC